MASDEGPVDTMPNMSPSWTRVFEIRLNRSRMRPVLRKSRCRSSTMIRKMRPAASLRGREGGRMMPSCVGGGGGAEQVVHAAAVHQRERLDVLLDAVLEDLEIVLRQVGDELVVVVPDDGVHVDEVDGDAGTSAACCAGWSARLAAAAARLAGAPCAASADADRQGQDSPRPETKSLGIA